VSKGLKGFRLKNLDIGTHIKEIDYLSGEFCSVFSPELTGTPANHIETDIAGAATISGLVLLRQSGIDLSTMKSGNVILDPDVDEASQQILDFMVTLAHLANIPYQSGWAQKIPDSHKPLIDTLELGAKLEEGFIQLCASLKLDRELYSLVAAMTAVKLIISAGEKNLLDLNVGKSIAAYYLIAGSKTVPVIVKFQ
jgi:hypothetical protein